MKYAWMVVALALVGCDSGRDPAFEAQERAAMAANAAANTKAAQEEAKVEAARLAEFGPRPQHTARSYVREFLATVLKDPDSVKGLEVDEPRAHTQGKGKAALKGWAIRYQMNAKNGFGAYTGAQEGWILLRGETVIWASPIQ